MLKTYSYPIYNKNGTVRQKKVTVIIKKIPRTPEEITDMQKLYDAGIQLRYILKKHKISSYNFKKIINTKVDPANPGEFI